MDDFKIYNDTYGHNAGDLALITTVEAIRRCIRKNDTLIRYGGDEFLLVLQGISETMFFRFFARYINLSASITVSSTVLPADMTPPILADN